MASKNTPDEYFVNNTNLLCTMSVRSGIPTVQCSMFLETMVFLESEQILLKRIFLDLTQISLELWGVGAGS